MNLYEERQKEMMDADDETYWRCNVEEELKKLGNNIPSKATMTTQMCRFISWLCRAALTMIKESKKSDEVTHWKIIHPSGVAECAQCKGVVLSNDLEEYQFCHHCGRRVVGITFKEDQEEKQNENNS